MRFDVSSGQVMSLYAACTIPSTPTSSSSSSNSWADRIVDPMDQMSLEDQDSLDRMSPSIWPKRSTPGGLTRCANSHRTVASSMPTTHCNLQAEQHCIVEAKQIEIDFASLTARPFVARIEAPNGEISHDINFPGYGTTKFFCPKQDGCGHGDWKFEVFEIRENKLESVCIETVYLDGVGSLFFTVGDDMRPRLASQEFLRLPSAARCCRRCQEKKPSGDSRSA